MKLSLAPTLPSLVPALDQVFALAGTKILNLDKTWDAKNGTPVFTVRGKYTTRGWTEWTQGFQFGMPILLFDAVRDPQFLALGRNRTVERMAPHVSHIGVHDHGFNNISTYGNLRRLMLEGIIPYDPQEKNFYELALKVSGAVQGARWTAIPGNPKSAPDTRDTGFIHSFNGRHSLFSDTIRSLRSLVLAHQLGHTLMSENDRPVNLLDRAIQHALTTAQYNVYYGKGRDAWDTPKESGRVVHESIFNITDGRYRCPSTQQGYSPFSTWTRGLAWILTGFAEQLEFLADPAAHTVIRAGALSSILSTFVNAATATADWYLAHSFDDGMVYWDAGAPNIPKEIDPMSQLPITNYQLPSNPYNHHEPIDSSAAAIAGQGFLRLANYFAHSDKKRSKKYHAAALLIAQTLFSEPYLATDPQHQGLILHSIYHRPNNWDHIPKNSKIPCGESSMWGDYHALELALLLKRAAANEPYITFFDR